MSSGESADIPSEGTNRADSGAQLTPRAAGYRMPAEWAPHASTWLSWPHKEASWPGKFEPIPKLYAHLVRTLSRHEAVNILAGQDEVYAQAQQMVGNLKNVTVHRVTTDDAWLRDSGPTFLVGPANSVPTLLNWGYNAWGDKYPPYENDDLIPTEIAAITKRRIITPGMILEGGAVDVNGAGCLLTTEQCLLNENRNPSLSREQIEKMLRDNLNVEKILWLKEGVVGDDTDGHIDELARFVNETTIVCGVEQNPNDENYTVLQENYRTLQALPISMGTSSLSFRCRCLPHCSTMASACQLVIAIFYIANGVVIVPQFDDPADWVVLDILRPLFLVVKC